MSLHDVIVLDDIDINALDESDGNEMYHNQMRRKSHRNRRKCNKIAELVKEVHWLRKRNELMSVLCGIARHQYIIDAAMTIQSNVRGWILRRDKVAFENALCMFLRNCRMFLQRKKHQRMKKSALVIQSHIRAFFIRKTPIGKAIKALLQYKCDTTKLEILTLRLTSMLCTNVEKNQIRIE